MKTYRVTMPNCDEVVIAADKYTPVYANCIEFKRRVVLGNDWRDETVALVQGPSFIIEDVTESYKNYNPNE